MKKFTSLNDLVWWLQNNGGGSVVVDVKASTGDDAVMICVNGSVTGKGRFLKGALAELNGEGA